MGPAAVDDDGAASTPPKLSLFSFPTKAKLEKPQRMETLPLPTTISIPFKWEEAPGKPRPWDGGKKPGGDAAVRCLELPPRLLQLSDAKVMPSPTTVLDGSCVGRSVSLRKGGSLRISEGNKRVLFGSRSSRWESFRKMSGEVAAADNGFQLSSKVTIDSGDVVTGRGMKVKMKRVGTKGRSLPSLSHPRSHVWASIYASLKQVVPWKNRTKAS